jgi:4-hydroxy-tetrahydrodipicolinate reductase
VGRALAPAIIGSSDLALVGAVSRSNSGKDLGAVLNIPEFNLTISGSVEDALTKDTDILIDYTSPEVVKSNVLAAIDRRVNVVVGTSGLSDGDYEKIDEEAKKNHVGVVAAGNFAISAVLLLHFSTLAAKLMPSWEIIDYAAEKKVDAPSGTARELAFRLSSVNSPRAEVSPANVIGIPTSRGATLNNIQVHSIRLPSYVIGAEVIFGKGDERLSLRYDGGSGAEAYVDGTLLATRKAIHTVGLARGLDKLIEF